MSILKNKNNLYRTKTFWLIKKWFEKTPIFIFWAQIFKIDYNFNKNKNSARLLLSSVAPFITGVIYSTFIILIFETFNYLFPVDQKIFSNQVVDTLLSAIASISGVFLGLYFTAISGMASASLLKATQRVRRYFLSTPIGEQYVRTVAFTGIVSIFYLLAKSFNHPIHPVGLVFLSISGVYIIIRFWTVGAEVFYSLEPNSSHPLIIKDISDFLNGVIPPGFKWNNFAIQNKQRQLVSENLDLMNDLTDFGIKEIKLQSEQLYVALLSFGRLLFLYPQYKKKIPTNSFWYKTKSQYESWALADSTQITLALNTGTNIQPKIIKDFTWFEEETLDMAIKIFGVYEGEKKISSVSQGLEIFVEVAEVYGSEFDEAGLMLLFKKAEKVVEMVKLEKIKDFKKVLYKEQMIFVDTQGRLAVGALLGLIKYLSRVSVDDLSKTISNTKWHLDKGPYVTGLPFAVLQRLESTASDLKNEILIEGQRFSPDWYIRTLCFQKYLFSLLSYFNYLKTFHSNYFQVKLEKLLTEDQLDLAVQLIQRWGEFSHKYSNLVNLISKHIEECAQFHQVKDLSWIIFGSKEEEKISSDREKEITDRMIKLLPRLTSTNVEEDMPDYFGKALTEGVQACYEACEDNDHTRLKIIFPIVFVASLSAYESTRQIVQNWTEDKSKIIYSTEPLINLYELSGFARLYSELYQNNELWTAVQAQWDAYLANVDAPKVIGYISAVCSYRAGLFMIMPQGILRTDWQIRFSNKMRDNGLAIFPDSKSYDYVNGYANPDHVSAIIRAVARRGVLGLSVGQTVFFATYLSNHSGATGIELPDQQDLKKQILREEKNINKDINEDE